MNTAPMTKRAAMQAQHISDELDLEDPDRADLFQEQLLDALERVVESPQVGTPREEWTRTLGARVRSRHVGNHHMLYLSDHPRLPVIGIYHDRSDIEARLGGLDIERELEDLDP